MSYHVAVSLRRVMGGKVSRPDLRDAALRSAGRPAARRPPALCGERGCRPAMDESRGGPYAATVLCQSLEPGNTRVGSARHGSNAGAGL